MSDMPRFALRPEPAAPLGYELYLWIDHEEGLAGWAECRVSIQAIDGMPKGLLSTGYEHELMPLRVES